MCKPGLVCNFLLILYNQYEANTHKALYYIFLYNIYYVDTYL